MDLYNSLWIVCVFCLGHLLGGPNFFHHFTLPVSGVKLPEEKYMKESVLEGKGHVYTLDATCLFTDLNNMNPAGRIT